jgi:hypothetical protein
VGFFATIQFIETPQAEAMAGNAVPAFDYPRDPNYLVLQYTHVHGMLENPDPIPFLRIYGDGRILIHYPIYMKRAGDYELRLSDAELQQLLSSLDATGVMGFNIQSMESIEAQLKANVSGQIATVESDVTLTVIETHVTRIIPTLIGTSSEQVNNKVVLGNVKSRAERYPEIVELQGIAAAEQQLQALTKRKDLIKLK